MMITRLVISLRKAASALGLAGTANHPFQTVEGVRFAQQTIGGTEYVDDITPSGMESARFSRRVIGGAGHGDDIALKHISPEGMVDLSNGYD